MQAITEQLRAFIKDRFLFGQSADQLQEDDSFLEKGIIDSTGVMELVAFIEEQYGVSVGDEELVPDNLDSLKRVSTFVGKKLGRMTALASA